MTTGIVLLAFYSLGLGLPFLLASLALNLFLSTFEKMRRYMKVIIFISGFFLIGVGILLLTGTFRVVTDYFNFLASPD
jgi:cytochrome c-type biogenesis protein